MRLTVRESASGVARRRYAGGVQVCAAAAGHRTRARNRPCPVAWLLRRPWSLAFAPDRASHQLVSLVASQLRTPASNEATRDHRTPSVRTSGSPPRCSSWEASAPPQRPPPGYSGRAGEGRVTVSRSSGSHRLPSGSRHLSTGGRARSSYPPDRRHSAPSHPRDMRAGQRAHPEDVTLTGPVDTAERRAHDGHQSQDDHPRTRGSHGETRDTIHDGPRTARTAAPTGPTGRSPRSSARSAAQSCHNGGPLRWRSEATSFTSRPNQSVA